MKMLLATATALAVAAVSSPAAAERAAGHGVTVHSGSQFSHPRGGFGDFDRRDRRRHRTDVILNTWGGDWALYNNRHFEPDSYNDWWHDRPDRSYPRWVLNGGCDRLWWGGGGWRCR